MAQKKNGEPVGSLWQKGPGGNEPTTHPDYAAQVSTSSHGLGDAPVSTPSPKSSAKKKTAKKPRTGRG